MNKLRSKKYLYWQIPSPMFTPVERNRILKLLFEALEIKNFDKFNDLIREGIHEIGIPCHKKRPNRKRFDSAVWNFSKDDRHQTLYKYVYTKHQCWHMDKEQDRINKKIEKRRKKILLRCMAMFEE